jgi:hypothetical protein
MTTARLDKTATIEDLAQVAQRRIPSPFIYDISQFGDAIVAQLI